MEQAAFARAMSTYDEFRHPGKWETQEQCISARGRKSNCWALTNRSFTLSVNSKGKPHPSIRATTGTTQVVYEMDGAHGRL